jgi:oxalate decarboxylase
MKVNTLDDDHRGLTRRQLLGLATLTNAGPAAASVGVPEIKAAPKPGEQYEPLEDFKHDLEGSEGWVGEGGSAKESTVKQLPVATSIAGVSMLLKPGALREMHKLPRESIGIAPPQIGLSSST